MRLYWAPPTARHRKIIYYLKNTDYNTENKDRP
jgi:hypothetical protein